MVMLGLDAAGKTTLLYRLLHGSAGEVETTIPTIGFNLETLEIQQTQLRCWDVGGCDKIRPLWRPYTTGVNAIIFVVDSHDTERFDQAKEQLDIFLNDDTCTHVPLLVVANKQDLLGARPLAEVVAALGLSEVSDRNWYAQAVSCVQGAGIPPCFEWLESILQGKPRPLHLTGISSPSATPGPASAAPAPVLSSALIAAAAASADLNSAEVWQLAQDELLRDVARRDATGREWLARADAPLADFVALADAFALESWDHYPHVRLAWAAVRLHGVERGLARVDAWVAGFIAANPARTGGRSFNATLTRAWAHLVATQVLEQLRACSACGGADFKRFLAIHFEQRTPASYRGRDLTSAAMPRQFYSPAVLFGPEARARPVRPDLAPLPDLFASDYFSQAGCGGAGCPAAGGRLPLLEAFAGDRAWFAAQDYHLLQEGPARGLPWSLG